MQTDKRILVVSKEPQQLMHDLGSLVLTYQTTKESTIPEEFDQFDAIILHDLPANIAELADNYEIPVLATERIAEQVKALKYDRFVSIAQKGEEQSRLEDLLGRKEDVHMRWKEIQSTFKVKYLDVKPTLDTAVHQQGISHFEAFYSFVERNTKTFDEITSALMIPFSRARDEMEMYWEKLESRAGDANEQYFRGKTAEYLAVYLDHARKRREHLTNLFKLSSPSASGGSHYLYHDVKEARKGAQVSFLKEVRDREQMSHRVIADIIHLDAKHFNQEGRETGLRLPKSRPPITHGNRTYILRESIIGPDLEDMLMYIRRRVPKCDARQRSWLRQLREMMVYQVFRHVLQWQRDAPGINVTDVAPTPDWIVKHQRAYLNHAFATYSRYLPVSSDEQRLWDASSSIYDADNLDLSKPTIKRHFDASTANIKFYTGSLKTPQIDDLEVMLDAKSTRPMDDATKKRVEQRLHYVDTGFNYSHEDEDFFHVACSFALHEGGKSADEKLQTIENYYTRFNAFRGRGRKKPDSLAYRLSGFYRGFVSGHLNLNKYERENKNHRLVREKIMHRLGLADAFASDAMRFMNAGDAVAEDIRQVPAMLCDQIDVYKQRFDSAQDKDSRQQYQLELSAAQLYGLQYFAKKFGKIKVQPADPASQPADQ